ncbi:MAG: radical SAM protein [Endomicrobiales bacterium]|nr:radical SAM protein [Endomicrobiales bacterium]
MRTKELKYIYGPVASWRIGASLGIDPVVKDAKTCSFDCVYCQIGRTKNLTGRRDEFVPVADIMREVNSLPETDIDYVTFAGSGEPTLARNLDKMILAVKAVRKDKIAVITNSSIMNKKQVRDALCLSDFVIAKLDACDDRSLSLINRPAHGIAIEEIVGGIIDFKSEFSGKLAVQVMFIEQNRALAKELAALVGTINPDEVQINTPLRPCPVAPLSKKEMAVIRDEFIRICSPKGISVKSVYDQAPQKKVEPISSAQTIRRRGKPV